MTIRSEPSMRRGRWWLLVAATCSLGLLSGPLEAWGTFRAQDVDDRIQATLWRTWEADGVTIVDGLANVPVSILDAATDMRYRFELSVRDASGATLFRDSWVREVSERAAAEAQGAAIQEAFRFGVRPGSYEVDLVAYGLETPDIHARTVLSLEGFAEMPGTSDLFLASQVEPVDETGTAQWSIVHGGVGIAGSAEAVVLLSQPEIYYYLELYAPASGDEGLEGTEVGVSAEVLDETGNVLLRTPVQSVVVDSEEAFTGRLDLMGLPPGEYRLAMEVQGSDGPARSYATFRATSEKDMVPGSVPMQGAVASYLNSLSDEELEARFGAMELVVSETERELYLRLPPDAKRRYLVGFFGARDPNPLDDSNGFFDEFITRVDHIYGRFDEEAGVPPWKTARGRIYLRNGEPANRVAQYFPADEGFATTTRAPSFAGEPPYEIWSYQETGYVYLFVMENRVGVWRLIFSTDPMIQTLPDWEQRCGNGAKQDLIEQFGVRPRTIE